MKRNRKTLLLVFLALAAMSLRIQYKQLGWGRYFSVDIVSPWSR